MNIISTQAVDIALSTLREEDRRRMTAWFEHLKNWETDEFVRKRSHKLNDEEDVYVLKTNTDLRIFFKLEKRDIVLLDIAHKDTILSFRNGEDHRR